MKPVVSRRDRTIQILKLIALGVLLIGIGASPPPNAIARILKEMMMKDTRENRRYVQRKIKELDKRGYTSKRGSAYAVSPRGMRLLNEDQLWDMTVPVPKRWDGRWHFVMFDIPVRCSKARKDFGACLHSLGLHTYQHSVFVHPYPIREIVQKVAAFYSVLPYVSFAIAESVDGEATLKRHFNIT